jgi:hypothetical protein
LVVIEIMRSAYDDRMRAVGRFGPPIALMGLIFVFSAQPDLNSGLGLLDTILRKLAHMAEFGLLWFLWLRALGHRPLAAVLSAVISGAYAATDELHQLFVHGRVASPLDWAIDCAGIGITWLVWGRFRTPRGSGASDAASGST